MKARIWRWIGVTALAALAVPTGASDEGAALPDGPVTTAASATLPASEAGTNLPPTQVILPAKVDLPPKLAEVARLAESGVDQSVILAYVQKSPRPYAVSADQIVYLRDLGVSEPVLKALVDHGSAGPVEGTGSVAVSPAATAQTSPPGASAPQAETPAQAPSATTASPPASGAASSFYDSLAPYGTWLDAPGYGCCWQPTVVAANPAWQPYRDDGYWLWSDDGWYWNSYYSWGWAPFHYGRWCRYPKYGWLWVPDHVWGPAWVCWRNWGDYCGWAPLPPGACFTAGLGWTFGGVGVGFDFGFGLPWSCFSFVPYRHFCDRDWPEHRLGEHEARGIFDRSRVNNHFVAGPDHRIINRGVDPGRVVVATRTPLRTVAVREMPQGAGRSAMPGRLERTGTSLTVYRPGSNLSVPKDLALGSLHTVNELGGTLGSWWAHQPASGSSVTAHGSSPSWSAPSAGRFEQRAPRPANSPGSRSEASHFRAAPTAHAPAEPIHSQAPTARPMSGRGLHAYYSSPSAHSGSAPSLSSAAPHYSFRSTPSRSAVAPAYSQPSYSWRSTRSWSVPRASMPQSSLYSHSFSSPSFASHPSRSFGRGQSSGFYSGGHGAWGGGAARGFGRR